MKVRLFGAITVIVAICQLYGSGHPVTATILLLLFLEAIE